MHARDFSYDAGSELTREEAMDAVAALEPLPHDTLLPLHYVRAIARALGERAGPVALHEDAQPAPPGSWRERLWTAPDECRIGVTEVCEAIGRKKSFVYKATMKTAQNRIPHRRLGGELVFLCGEIRAWLRESEDVVRAGPMRGPETR